MPGGELPVVMPKADSDDIVDMNFQLGSDIVLILAIP